MDYALKKFVILKHLPQKYDDMILARPFSDHLIEALYQYIITN